MRKTLNLEDYKGAIAVLENYLDGAVSDYEAGVIDDTCCIMGSINAIKLIYQLSDPIMLLGGLEYENRMRKAINERNN